MANFWDYKVWGGPSLVAVMGIAMLLANALKCRSRLLKRSLIPTSVLAGAMLLVLSAVYRALAGNTLFDAPFFGDNGQSLLEIITYHALALGFIASALRTNGSKLTRKRRSEIFNTGLTTVSSYLLQGVAGLLITIVYAAVVKDFFPAAGVLLPFGYGQGTGQALNYGSIYEAEYGFVGGRSFGLSIAALGFLSASIGGVIYLNVIARRKGEAGREEAGKTVRLDEIQTPDEIPMNGSLDKLTVQFSLVFGAYFAAYLLMTALGSLAPGLRSVVYGFNFLFGVIAAVVLKQILRVMPGIRRTYTNNFLLSRISNTFFDLMVVAGIAAIRLEVLESYWGILLFLGLVGLVLTFVYNRYVAKKLFADYEEEQFLMMYGMLTGTASTGIMLLREADPDFKTPAAENLVYQNFPAMVFGFPLMFLATMAPVHPWLVWIILVVFFAVMNLILFRGHLSFGKK